MSYQHIVLAIDLSNNYDHIVKRAKEIVGDTHAKLSIISIIPNTAMLSGVLASDEEGKLSTHYHERMQKIISNLGVIVEDTNITQGKAKSDIVKYAKRQNADLLIIGHHHDNPVHEFFLGSTAHAILNSAPCDVTIIKNSSTQ